MKKRNILLATALLSVGSVFAQTLPDGMTALLPSGVTPNITQDKKFIMQKNLTVAGSPEKGYYAFFSASDSDHGEELWVTDGTPEGTRMVKDINPGVATSDVNYLTRFNDKVVFSADNGEDGYQLWISDGTEEGTRMVKKIHEFDSSNPIGFCQMNETQFIFFASDYESENFSSEGAQKWLYVSDGTEEGTKLVAQVDCQFPGEDIDHRYGAVIRVGRKVFFKGDVADKTGTTYGLELWVTDGTTEGTYMVKDINLEKNVNKEGSTLSSAINSMQNFYNEGLFFKAWDEDHGNEPWFTDGTEEGTYLIYDTDPTVGANGIGVGGGVTMVGEVYNGEICFRGKDPKLGCEFGVTNCEKGNFKCFDIFTVEPTQDHQSFADNGVVFDDKYMFCANTGTDANIESCKGGELHWYDGEKVQMQYDFAPGVGCDWVKELTVAGGSLYWWNEGNMDGTTTTDTKLIRLDKWDGVPQIVSNIDANGDKIYCLRNLNGELLFTSKASNQLYCYHYRQDGYDPAKNPDKMEPEYRTREEIETGIENVTDNKTNSFEIYPNPATETFRIKGIDTMKSNLKIYDISGRLVKSIDNVSVCDAISVSDLAAGMYEVIASSATGTKSTRLIVK